MKFRTSILLSASALTLAAFAPGLYGQAAPTTWTLYSFTDGTDGVSPLGSLVGGADGDAYGIAQAGGINSGGTIFKVTAGGALTTLYSFSISGAGPSFPGAGLVLGTDGSFYGTTEQGGGAHAGAFFKITPTGAFTTLYFFTGGAKDGADPKAGLIQNTDGNFYGTTETGGVDGAGTVFMITAKGAITILHSFTGSGTDGAFPQASLIKGSDGNFYGTTPYGGSSNDGTVFRMAAGGKLTTLHSFTATGTDGGTPLASLVQGSDGNFYGTTAYGGVSGAGTVFRITAAGTLTTLHSFTGIGTEGASPYAGLIPGGDGFYGTTFGGGSANAGTVFQITATGALTTLYSFTATGTDGAYPDAGLVQTGSTILGTTVFGGATYNGTVFKVDASAGGTSAAIVSRAIPAAPTPRSTEQAGRSQRQPGDERKSVVARGAAHPSATPEP